MHPGDGARPGRKRPAEDTRRGKRTCVPLVLVPSTPAVDLPRAVPPAAPRAQTPPPPQPCATLPTAGRSWLDSARAAAGRQNARARQAKAKQGRPRSRKLSCVPVNESRVLASGSRPPPTERSQPSCSGSASSSSPSVCSNISKQSDSSRFGCSTQPLRPEQLQQLNSEGASASTPPAIEVAPRLPLPQPALPEPHSSPRPVVQRQPDGVGRCPAGNAPPAQHQPGEQGSGVPVRSLRHWGVPPAAVEVYRRRGIEQIYEWQAQCLAEEGVTTGSNLVYCAPTSGGKTLVSEILMLRMVSEVKKQVVMVLPFVSLVQEKLVDLTPLFGAIGRTVAAFHGGSGPNAESWDVALCTMEKANSMLNKMIEEKRMSQLGMVVVDEAHMIGEHDRGYILELFLAKLQFYDSERHVQIVAMSATLPNVKQIAQWLRARLFISTSRPIPLREYVKFKDDVVDDKGNKVATLPGALVPPSLTDSDHVAILASEVCDKRRNVLVFCASKRQCETCALAIAKNFQAMEAHREAAVRRCAATGKDPACHAPHQAESESAVPPGALFERGLLSWQTGAEWQQARTPHTRVLSAEDLRRRREFVVDRLRRSPGGLDATLEVSIPVGVAFHHAGMTMEERSIVEKAYREGAIGVLTCTSTLAAGVNLPAQRVLFRSFKVLCVGTEGEGDSAKYKQMCGRAGRKGKDAFGESVLICSSAKEYRQAQTLLGSALPEIKSGLGEAGNAHGMTRLLLEVVTVGLVRFTTDIARFVTCTFTHAQAVGSLGAKGGYAEVAGQVKTSLGFLEREGFITYRAASKSYLPSPLGEACYASSLNPVHGLFVFQELSSSLRRLVLLDDLHVVYHVTPVRHPVRLDFPTLMHSLMQDMPAAHCEIANAVGVSERSYLRLREPPSGDAPKSQEEWEAFKSFERHRRFFLALILRDLVNEEPMSEVSRRYKMERGALQALQTSAATFSGMVQLFCERLHWEHLLALVKPMKERLNHGAQQDLLPLMGIPYIKTARARELHRAGFRTVRSVAEADVGDLADVLRNCGSALLPKSRSGPAVAALARKIKDSAAARIDEEARRLERRAEDDPFALEADDDE